MGAGTGEGGRGRLRYRDGAAVDRGGAALVLGRVGSGSLKVAQFLARKTTLGGMG